MSRRLARARSWLPAAALVSTLVLAPVVADAFCGFYVAGADAKLFNDATMVVMMREGRRTVLAMQNAYAGPPEDFAMVVPVPVVLSEDDVKILPQAVFDRVDHLAAPRLVEYWEVDPCNIPRPRPTKSSVRSAGSKGGGGGAPAADFGVTVEAEFVVGEYEVVILSAKDSTGLDGWLRQENYKIPKGADDLLRPYVQSGHKFFVAKVDVDKVKFVNGRAALSPLRVHYDSDDFSLPIRLGLINASGGPQDLIVHILADQRYEAANYANVAIPTNIEVKDQTRKRFGSFYASLFDDTLRQHPGAVVTEYAWAAGSCDPCPEPPLQDQEIATLGGDVLTSQPSPYNLVLTRLHARYDAGSLGNDLVFRVAKPIVGGREHVVDDKGALERDAVESGYNNFQARYIIRHPWKGPIKCKNPRRGIWGGPWDGGGNSRPTVAEDLAFVARDAKVASYVQKKDQSRTSVALLSEGDASLAPAPVPDEPEPDTGVDDPAPTPAGDPSSPDSGGEGVAIDDGPDTPQSRGCAHCSSAASDRSGGALGGLALLGLLAWRRRSGPATRS